MYINLDIVKINIKTDIRNRMKTPLLTSLMQLKINGPEMSSTIFICRAYDIGASRKARMPQRGSRNRHPNKIKRKEKYFRDLFE
jgi:hypothetical protein